MSHHDPMVPLREMLDFARETVDLVKGRCRADLDTDRHFCLLVTHLLELVGEAAGRVPVPDQARCPGIPWKGIIGLRNRLIHGYDVINHDILWAAASCDLPGLIAELEKIVPPAAR